jgi:glycosyltransferase involved in cell wall biosynthesis
VYESTRVFLLDLAWKLWSRPRRAIKRARLVLTSNYETAERVKEIRKSDPVITFSDVGVHSVGDSNGASGKLRPHGPLRLLWSARLIPLKNFGLLLDALKGLPPDLNWVLRVAGEGQLRSFWQNKVHECGLTHSVMFLGRVEYSHMVNEYRMADIFVFPSLREATGTALIEAMSHGVPAIALEMHGARVVIDNSCGILVPTLNIRQMVDDFRDAILKLCLDPALRRRMGEAARERVANYFLWQGKGDMLSEIYREILGSNRDARHHETSIHN